MTNEVWPIAVPQLDPYQLSKAGQLLNDIVSKYVLRRYMILVHLPCGQEFKFSPLPGLEGHDEVPATDLVLWMLEHHDQCQAPASPAPPRKIFGLT